MSNYYLNIKNKKIRKDNYKEIKWIEYFKNVDINPNSLENIDLFTTKFDNIMELKTFLVKNKLIKSNQIETDEISINYKYNGYYKKTGILFNQDLKFLDPNYLVHYIMMKSDRLFFLQKFYEFYRNKTNDSEYLEIIKNYIANIQINIPYTDEEKTENSEYVYWAIKRFTELQIYKFSYSRNSFLEDENGELIIKYKPLHDLVYFISNYSKKYDDKETIEMIDSCYCKREKENSKEFKKKVKSI